MDSCRKAWLTHTTLFFFLMMLVFGPAQAQQAGPGVSGRVAALANSDDLPVHYLSEQDARRLVADLRHRGYVVREGSLPQLVQLAEATPPATQDRAQTDAQPCVKAPSPSTADPATPRDCSTRQGETLQEQLNEEVMKTGSVPPPVPESPSDPPLASEPLSPPAESHVSVGVQGNFAYSSGGGNRDFAKVFFIFAGFVMVAAFVVYAGKYISDMASGKAQKMWWEVVSNSTFLDTKAGRHGTFLGAKLATGVVSDELIQLALVVEAGKTQLDLVLNEYTDPTVLDFSASYWMLGGSARLHLTDALVNASYLYLDLLGGSTSNGATDIIGAARLGASFGLNDHWRLGASLGAQYIGLDEGQGFANDGDNYWLTYGVELGARF